jgi:hypothetical protein
MPDSALYPVKLAAEEFQLALTHSDIDRTELNDSFANRRADEIVYLASKGDVDRVAVTTERLNTNLKNMTKLTGDEVEKSKGATNHKDIPSADIAATVAFGSATPSASQEFQVPVIESTPTDNPEATDAIQQLPVGKSFTDAVRDNSKTAETQREQSAEHTAGKELSPKLEKLRQMISANFEKRQNRLEEALKKAAPGVKPALSLAIAKSKAEYDKAIQNLNDTHPEKD